jgi:hypothetical protein
VPPAAAPTPSGQPTTATTIAPPPPPGTVPGGVPLPATPPSSAVVHVSPGPTQPSASPIALDARALTIRGITRELDGDHAGALQDLNAALVLEPDHARRAAIERLIRQLEPRR